MSYLRVYKVFILVIFFSRFLDCHITKKGLLRLALNKQRTPVFIYVHDYCNFTTLTTLKDAV